MRRCQTCGHPITGEAREVTPDSDSAARPTLYVHRSRVDCAAAKRARS
ncbi:hypothetical protein ACFQ67_11540 [Streptomyces sp. NPDC056488]